MVLNRRYGSFFKKINKGLLEWKEIKPVNHKVNQPWIFIGRTVAEAPIFWSPDAKRWLIVTLMLWKIECKRRRGWQRMRWLHRITASVDVNLGKLRGSGVLQGVGLQRVSWGCDLVAEQQQTQTLKPYRDNTNKAIYKSFNSVSKKCKSFK